MKTFLMAVAGVVLSVGTAMADPLEGRWLTSRDDNGNFGMIEVAPCGAALCGTLVQAYDGNAAQIPSDNIGRQIIFDTVNDGSGNYSGKIYSPDRDATYNSRLVLNGDRLNVSGCRLGICRAGGVWQRQ